MAASPKAPRLPRWTRLCVSIGSLLILVATGLLGTTTALSARYDGNIKRQDLLGNGSDQLADVKGPMNILLIGSDSRATEIFNPDDPSSSKAAVQTERSDTIMLLHLTADLKNGYVVSIPRDTYVDIPAMGDDWDGGRNKINAAYAYGGAPGLVKTVEKFSGLPVDHVVVVDFAAIRSITDAVGGVDVTVDKTTVDKRSKREFRAGVNHLNGREAEDYVRQRYGLPGGDFDRVKRQQQFLFALLRKVTDSGVVKDPRKLDRLLLAVTGALTVDRSMPVKDLALTLKQHGFGPDRVKFMTVPIAGDDSVDGIGYVALADEERTPALFAAMRDGTLPAYLAANPPNDPTRGS